MIVHYRLRKGDRVAIVMRNHPQWQVAFWATQLAGLIAVPINSWWTAEEMALVLSDCSPDLVVADDERVERVLPWIKSRPGRPWLLTPGRHAVPNGELPRHDRFEALAPDGETAPAVRVTPDDDAAIIYTSGTTSRPKGVVLTHRNICACALNGSWTGIRTAVEDGREIDGIAPPVMMLTFPFFHVAALTVVLANMTIGGTIVLLHKWDADVARETIARHAVTAFTGVPTTALQLLDTTPGDPRLATLQALVTGGAPAPEDLVRQVTGRFAGRITGGNSYGLTETCGAVIGTAGAGYESHLASIGRPTPATRVRVVRPDGGRCADGEIGELQLLGQSVFRGYWEDPEATEAAFDHGWFRTGDLARAENGELHVVDRINDVVIRGGENVYCVEVESVLFDHPDVADATVLGVPHPVLGEEVAALVVPRPGRTPDPHALQEYVAGRLARFKVPSLINVRSEPLPRNASGKVLKRQLRTSLAAADAA
jgi:acyl-CoA synthetase (AMP-forming)/AMP-acid ligase II